MKWIVMLVIIWVSGPGPVGAQDALQTYDQRPPTRGRIVPEAAYPTYGAYEDLLFELARRYPDRCRVEVWGTLSSGRRILTLRLTQGIHTDWPRPRVLCTAAMHGDELAGYWVLLRLAEDLLRNDEHDLLRQAIVYINPLANPDGAFAGGNHTLAGARRGNANGVDLNRNYPDPDDGRYPDGNVHQAETRIFMRAAEQRAFDLAINFHGGAELFNYPWDTFRTRHPDTDWWRKVSREFAQRAQHDSPDGTYFKDRSNGVTNGHDWYPIAGSRQDYMNYYHRTREATVEITTAKRLPAKELPLLWTSLRGALLGYLLEATYGIHGMVTDRLTGRPVRAHITIPGHDEMQSSVYSSLQSGDFYRYLAPGTYRLQVSAPGYRKRTLIVSLENKQRRYVRVALERVTDAVPARKK
ncbi:M14 family zinc carboxypeptidase [Neolewinella maritima]|uniref:M14 family zinc carboxypeptidase n=1 Tax=Neolewinella maritima TaxID=1383882 RepID=UPI001EE94730|nr:M14 family zinc carboxypeptidase [Neolewinella maritima]